MTLLHTHLNQLAPYPPGKPIEEAQREYGLSEVTKLASNENPMGPSPLAAEATRRALNEMHLYPDGAGYVLKNKLSEHLGVAPEEIILGNGSDEITLFLALCYLGPGRSMVTSDYAFVRYLMAAKLINASPRLVTMINYRHDTRGMLEAIDDSTALLFLDNPCNPTGSMATAEEIKELVARVPPHVLIVMDEAYYEFAKSDSNYPNTLAMRAKHRNLVVTRTFSKAYGLAGLRIGYGIASPQIVQDLDRVRPPFNTNRLAQIAATAALDDHDHLAATIANNDQGKSYLTEAFDKLGLQPNPTWANFILVDLAGRFESAAKLYEALLREGTIVRPVGGYGLAHHVRISIGTPDENEKLVQALKKLLS